MKPPRTPRKNNIGVGFCYTYLIFHPRVASHMPLHGAPSRILYNNL